MNGRIVVARRIPTDRPQMLPSRYSSSGSNSGGCATAAAVASPPPRARSYKMTTLTTTTTTTKSFRWSTLLLVLFVSRPSPSRYAYRFHVAGQTTTTTTDRGAAAATQGYWEGPYELPIVATSVANLMDGNLLLWGAYDLLVTNRRGEGKTWTAVWDYRRPNVKPAGVLVETTGHDMFCPATAYLPDGKLMISGGSNNERVTIYDNGVWQKGADTILGRGYHSATVTADGSVFTMGGSWHDKKGKSDVSYFVWIFRYNIFKWWFDLFKPWPRKDGELWDPVTQKWKSLPGTQCDGTIITDDALGQYRADNHLWLFASPNGKMFHAGPAKMTHFLSLEGKGSVTATGVVRGVDDTMNGNALMYDIGKILTLGGSPDYDFSSGTDAAHIITLDPTGATDSVSIEPVVGGLVYARVMSNAVLLPNGQVVVVGGMETAITASVQGSILAAELFDPVSKTFTEMASMTIPRNYHSSAILLPDGRVFAGGGGHCHSCRTGPDTNKFNGEVYTPPYLVDPITNALVTNRPVITSAPATARPGESISVTTGSAVSSFALVRYSAVTHSTNNDARRIPLTPTSTAGTTYGLPLPRAAICVPGTYFLFVLNAAGVPSVATTISIRP